MDPTCVFNFFTFFERILYESNCLIFIFSWCGTHTKIRSKLVVIVMAGSQKITLWGPQRTPAGILRVNSRDICTYCSEELADGNSSSGFRWQSLHFYQTAVSQCRRWLFSRIIIVHLSVNKSDVSFPFVYLKNLNVFPFSVQWCSQEELQQRRSLRGRVTGWYEWSPQVESWNWRGLCIATNEKNRLSNWICISQFSYPCGFRQVYIQSGPKKCIHT